MSEPKLIDEQGYGRELLRLQSELIKLQYWIQSQDLRVVVLFEGRDAAGKGGVIRRIMQYTNPRIVRLVALPKPTERERGQWYFQRYVAHLPRVGEMVLFDRSWYNRAGVESVMGFCSEAEVQEFFMSCPKFEEMLINSGIKLIKYWFAISREEQERRFQARRDDLRKRWKLSAIDLEARSRWTDYTRARDQMFAHCHTEQAPWTVIDGNNKKQARLNCIHHLLSEFDYKDLTPPAGELPPGSEPDDYQGPPLPPGPPPAYQFNAEKKEKP